MFFRKKTVAELFNCSLWKQQLDYDSDDNRGEKPLKMHFMTPKDAIEFDVEDLSDQIDILAFRLQYSSTFGTGSDWLLDSSMWNIRDRLV